MKQKKYTDKYGNVYYDVTFQAGEAKYFHYEDPGTSHTATVTSDGLLCRVEEIDGKAAVSRWFRIHPAEGREWISTNVQTT